MENTPRTTLKLKLKPGAKKAPITTVVQAQPQAYVMPDETELSDAELSALSEEERERYMDRFIRRAGIPLHDLNSDPVQDAIESEHHRSFDEMEKDDLAYSVATETEKAAATIILAAEYSDFVRETPHEQVAYGVEIVASDEATKLLVIAVTVEVGRWTKPPKAEAVAHGIGLAIAKIRGEQGVKHPRDIAKEVGVRAQTLHRIKNVALQEIQRLGLKGDLIETGS
jgi:hypothetical protein